MEWANDNYIDNYHRYDSYSLNKQHTQKKTLQVRDKATHGLFFKFENELISKPKMLVKIGTVIAEQGMLQ